MDLFSIGLVLIETCEKELKVVEDLLFEDVVHSVFDESIELEGELGFILFEKEFDGFEEELEGFVEEGAEVDTVLGGDGVFLGDPELGFSGVVQEIVVLNLSVGEVSVEESKVFVGERGRAMSG